MPRPRSIPEEEVLQRALMLFWEKGYDRTSIADLSEAIGLGPSSIYNAFGSKEALFEKAIGRYMQEYTGFAAKLMAPDARGGAAEFALDLLAGAVRLYTTKGLPGGCAMLQSGGAGVPSDSTSCKFTCGIKRDLEAGIRQRLQGCQAAGDELAGTPRVLAQFLVATMRGLSQLAVDGTSRRDLLQIARHAARSCVSGAGLA